MSICRGVVVLAIVLAAVCAYRVYRPCPFCGVTPCTCLGGAPGALFDGNKK
jgi:hypothetical protein